MKENTKELHKHIIKIFESEQSTKFALEDDLFGDNYMKAFVLLMHYFKVYNVPKKVLEVCVDVETCPKDLYEIFYDYCQGIWEKKADREIKNLIKRMEKMTN